jgi:hypothetical protein
MCFPSGVMSKPGVMSKIQNVTGSPTALRPTRPERRHDRAENLSLCGADSPGGSLLVQRADAAGVRIYGVQAIHNNGIAASLIDAPGIPPGTTAYGGSAGGCAISPAKS